MNGYLDRLKRPSAQSANPPIGIRHEKPRQLVTIYGLFQNDGRCRYVGASETPRERDGNHRKIKKRHRLTMYALRRCSVAEAGRLELQILKAFKRRGQCDLNKNMAGKPDRQRRREVIYWIEENKIFETRQEAADYFGCTSATIKTYIDAYKITDSIEIITQHATLVTVIEGEQKIIVDYCI